MMRMLAVWHSPAIRVLRQAVCARSMLLEDAGRVFGGTAQVCGGGGRSGDLPERVEGMAGVGTRSPVGCAQLPESPHAPACRRHSIPALSPPQVDQPPHPCPSPGLLPGAVQPFMLLRETGVRSRKSQGACEHREEKGHCLSVKNTKHVLGLLGPGFHDGRGTGQQFCASLAPHCHPLMPPLLAGRQAAFVAGRFASAACECKPYCDTITGLLRHISK